MADSLTVPCLAEHVLEPSMSKPEVVLAVDYDEDNPFRSSASLCTLKETGVDRDANLDSNSDSDSDSDSDAGLPPGAKQDSDGDGLDVLPDMVHSIVHEAAVVDTGVAGHMQPSAGHTTQLHFACVAASPQRSNTQVRYVNTFRSLCPAATQSCSTVPVALPERENGPNPDEEAEEEECVDDIVESSGSAQERYHRIQKSIKLLLTDIRKKKMVLTDQKAVGTIFDLECLTRYNDEHFKLAHQRAHLAKKVKTCNPSLRRGLKARIAQIRPAMHASAHVAYAAGKTEHFAHRLRKMENHIYRTGQLPENRQGQGAAHPTLFSQPNIKSHLRQWAYGLVPEEEGGYVGKVIFRLSLQFVVSKGVIRYGRKNCDTM